MSCRVSDSKIRHISVAAKLRNSFHWVEGSVPRSTVLYLNTMSEQDILNGPSVAALHELQRTPLHHTSSHSLLIWYDSNICPLLWHRFICTLHRRYILPSVHLLILISHVSLLFRYSLTYWLLSKKSGFANQSFIQSQTLQTNFLSL